MDTRDPSGYVSGELTHFIARKLKDQPDRQYATLSTILRRPRRLLFDPALPNLAPVLDLRSDMRLCDDKMYRPAVVCFCDIPVSYLGIHMTKYGRFGIAFKKSFLIDKGANPVFYIAKESQTWTKPMDRTREFVMNQLLEEYHRLREQTLKQWDRGEPGGTRDWENLCVNLDYYVFSFFKCFEASLPKWDESNYYMEREWRVVGNVGFELSDVTRIILPKAYEKDLRRDFPEYTGPIEDADALSRGEIQTDLLGRPTGHDPAKGRF